MDRGSDIIKKLRLEIKDEFKRIKDINKDINDKIILYISKKKGIK